MTTTTSAPSHQPIDAPTWPDTTAQNRPLTSHVYASATWILGRHPLLARLARRIPDVVTVDQEQLHIDLDLLASAIDQFDDYGRAWRDYRRDSYTAPDPDHDPDRFSDWEDAGPWPSPGTAAFLPLSRTEKAQLRMLACFAPETRVPFAVDDLWGRDPEGQRLLRDWCIAVYQA